MVWLFLDSDLGSIYSTLGSAQGEAAYQSVPSTSKMIPFNGTASELGEVAELRGMKRFACLEKLSVDRDMMLDVSRCLESCTGLSDMDTGIAGRPLNSSRSITLMN